MPIENQKDYFIYGGYYHIYNVVVTGETLFKKDKDYLDFLERYAKYFEAYFDTYAYCLIPNHFHFLIRVKDESAIDLTAENTIAAKKVLEGVESINYFLEHQLSRMLSGISLKYNLSNKRVGPLFKQGTKRVELRTESRIVYQLCYTHHNPIHHGLVKKYEAWKYSSYRAYHSRKESKIEVDFMFEFLGGRDIFNELHLDFKLDSDLDH